MYGSVETLSRMEEKPETSGCRERFANVHGPFEGKLKTENLLAINWFREISGCCLDGNQ